MFLNGHMLVELLDFIRNNQMQEPKLLDTDICIVKHESPFEYNDKLMPPGLYAYLSKYPDEGLIGPLGEGLDNPRPVQLNSTCLVSFEQMDAMSRILTTIADGQSHDPARDASILLGMLQEHYPASSDHPMNDLDLETN